MAIALEARSMLCRGGQIDEAEVKWSGAGYFRREGHDRPMRPAVGQQAVQLHRMGMTDEMPIGYFSND